MSGAIPNTTQDELIHLFREVTGAETDVAAKFLKGNGNDVDRAASAYFDNPDPSRFDTSSWDDTTWNTDRTGDANAENSLVPYQFDENDGRPVYGPFAPSRPPSRSGGRILEGQAGQGYSNGMYAGEQEAIQRSLEGQQTGLIDTSGNEIVPDPEPDGRMRPVGAPAFVKPFPSNHFLPALVTILHSIPGFRQALFRGPNILADYNYSPHWWEGEPVGRGRVVDRMNLDGEQSENAALNMVHEMQRLIAFLDKSERAYCSAGPLYECSQSHYVDSYDELQRIISLLDEQLESYHGQSLFQSTVMSFDGPERMLAEKTEACQLINLHLNPWPLREKTATLYDVLDGRIWPHISPEWFEDHYFKDTGPILIFCLRRPRGENEKPAITIPHDFYADRYLLERNKDTQKMRLQMEQCLGSKEEVSKALEKVQSTRSDDGKILNAQNLLQATINQLREDGREDDEDEIVDAMDDSKDDDHAIADVISQLEAIAAKVNERVDLLKEQQSMAEERFVELSKLFTRPSQKPEEDPKVHYSLQGLACNYSSRVSVTYVRSSPRKELITFEQSNNDEYLSNTRWWKTTYDTATGSALVGVEPVSDTEVSQTALERGSSALLIYAKDSLMSVEVNNELPPPLQKFVDTDNEVFHQELDANKAPDLILGQSIDGAAVSPLEHDDPMLVDTSESQPTTVDPAMLGGRVIDPTQMPDGDHFDKEHEMEEIRRTF